MIVVAAWWLGAVVLLGLAIWPLTFRFFHSFADRGFGMSVPAGVLAFGLASWWVGVTGLAPNGPATSLVVVAGIAAAAWLTSAKTRREMRLTWRRRRGLLLIEATTFVGSFMAFLWVRTHMPDINGTEKFMDFAFLNAVATSDTFPPIDPWLAPSPTMPDPRINYYYLGYLCYGLIVQLTGVPPAEGFNLALATTFASVAVATFSLGYALARDQATTWARDRDPDDVGSPIAGGKWSTAPAVPYLVTGAATALLVLVAGNLWTVLRRIDGSRMWTKDFWTGIGWNATRVLVIKDGERDIDYTINEFPAFSFLLGDLHPHVLALPFAVLAIAMAYRWLLDPPHPFRLAAGVPWGSRFPGLEAKAPWRAMVDRAVPWLGVVPVTTTLGALYFANAWDFPTYLGLATVAGAAGALRWRRRGWADLGATAVGRFGVVVAAMAAAALIAIWPFVAEFRPPVVYAQGQLPIGTVTQRSELSQFLQFWGLHLLVVAPPLAGAAFLLAPGSTGRRVAWVAGGAGAVAVIAVAGEAASLGTLAVAGATSLVAAAVAARRLRATDARGTVSTAFGFLCIAFAAVLLGACELAYIRDFYGGSLRRMNTVFKLYYQAWLLLGIGAPQIGFWAWRAVATVRPAAQPLPDFERGSSAGREPGGGRVPVRLARRGLVGWWGLAAAGMAAYPLKAAVLRIEGFQGPATVDGMEWMRRYHPDDHAAARWLLANGATSSAQRAPVVLEATGGPYSEFGRMATQTGFPSVLGWDQHERLWRGEGAHAEVDRRRQDVERFYRDGSGPEARAVLERYGVAFVVRGYLEEQAYPGPGLDRIGAPESGLTEAFRSGATVVYVTSLPPRRRTGPVATVPPVRNSQ